MRSLCLIAAGSIALLPVPAVARDLMCQTLRRVDGGYTFRPEPGLDISAMIARPGPFVHGFGADVTGFSCYRDEPMPEVDDVEVLQAGYLFAVGSPRTEARVIILEVEGGRIVHDVRGGVLSESERRRLERIVARMQARLPAPPAP